MANTEGIVKASHHWNFSKTSSTNSPVSAVRLVWNRRS